MTNRDRYISKRNEYDMLCEMQATIGSGLCQCVIEALIGKSYPCPDERCCMLETCCKCIQKFLNEEE